MAETKQLTIVMRLKDLATKEFNRLRTVTSKFGARFTKKFNNIKRSVLNLKTVIISLIAAFAVKRIIASLVDAGRELENFRTQLVAVMDGARGAAEETLKWVRDFAARTPFMTAEVISAFIQLRSVGFNVTKDILETIGNVAFVFNRDIRDVASALISFEKEVLRRLGIEIDRVGTQAVITSGRMKVVTDNTADAIRKGLLQVWEKRFPGAMKEAENTYTGLMALLQSEWWEFRAAIMESGVLNMIKAGLKVMLDHIQRLKDEGRLKEWAKEISDSIINMIFTLILSVTKVRRLALHVVEFFSWVKSGLAFLGIGFSQLEIWVGKAIRFVLNLVNDAVIGFKYMFDTIKYYWDKVKIFFIDVLKGMLVKLNELTVEIRKILEKLPDEFVKDSWLEGITNLESNLTSAINTTERWKDKLGEEPKLKKGGLETVIKEFDTTITAIEKRQLGYLDVVQETYENIQDLWAKQTTLTGEEMEKLVAKIKEGMAQMKEAVEETPIKLKIDDPTEELEGWTAGFKLFADKARNAFRNTEEMAKRTAEAMGRHLGASFFDLFTTRTNNAREHFRNFLNDILRMISETLAKRVIAEFLGMFTAGGDGDVVGGTRFIPSGISTSAVAKGGIARGGFGGLIPAYAGGGIVSSPHLGLVGEGNRSEAIVPLPDNKSIPVEFTGGGRETNVTFNIFANDTAGFDALLMKRRETIKGMISEAVNSDRNFRKTINV